MGEHHPQHRRDGLFPQAWIEARERALTRDASDDFRILVRLLDRGGLLLGGVFRLYHDRETPAGDERPWEPLLDFVDEEITDAFRTIACGTAALIPYPRWEDFADPLEVQGDVLELSRFLKVAALAAEHPSVPAEVRRAFREVSSAMAGWEREMVDAVRRIGESYLAPAAD